MPKKVLVVDDEKLIVKGIRFSLEQDDMEVDTAYDGEEAVEMAREGNYDIILLDLMLPKLDGLSACQQIREFSDVPIVMLTAKGEDMDKILGLEYGADDYRPEAGLRCAQSAGGGSGSEPDRERVRRPGASGDEPE